MKEDVDAFPSLRKEIARRARAVFSSNNFYIRVGGNLANILKMIRPSMLADEQSPFRGPVPILAMVTYFQYVEGLRDTQAADALRTRIDWQYALHTPLNFPLLKPDALCAYRQSLLKNNQAQREFQALINLLIQFRPLRQEPSPAVGARELLGAVCTTNRVKWVYDATSDVVTVLAGRWPQWLEQIALPHWYTFYGDDASSPISAAKQDVVAHDACYLMETIRCARIAEVSNLPQVRNLEQVCRQQLIWSQRQPAQFLPACRSYGACPMATSAKEGQALQIQTRELNEGSDESRGAAPSSGG